jgi:hypothetical protein
MNDMAPENHADYFFTNEETMKPMQKTSTYDSLEDSCFKPSEVKINSTPEAHIKRKKKKKVPKIEISIV